MAALPHRPSPEEPCGEPRLLLAVDTTTDVCSVALACRNSPTPAQTQWIENTRLAPRMHNRHLLEMIDALVDASGFHKSAIDAVAFSAGPGSFTGVRIGAASAQAIAFGVAAEAVPVPTSAVVAETARRLLGRRGEAVVCRSSRPGWHYAARYALDDDGVRCLAFDRLFADRDRAPGAVDGDALRVSAGTVARLALAGYAPAVAPALAVPIYVEGDSPWQGAA